MGVTYSETHPSWYRDWVLIRGLSLCQYKQKTELKCDHSIRYSAFITAPLVFFFHFCSNKSLTPGNSVLRNRFYLNVCPSLLCQIMFSGEIKFWMKASGVSVVASQLTSSWGRFICSAAAMITVKPYIRSSVEAWHHLVIILGRYSQADSPKVKMSNNSDYIKKGIDDSSYFLDEVD